MADEDRTPRVVFAVKRVVGSAIEEAILLDISDLIMLWFRIGLERDDVRQWPGSIWVRYRYSVDRVR